jgi:hypothetical protein
MDFVPERIIGLFRLPRLSLGARLVAGAPNMHREPASQVIISTTTTYPLTSSINWLREWVGDLIITLHSVDIRKE